MRTDPNTTKKHLIEAARAEFLELGWEGARGEGIRKRAKVSNGSWRHFFPGGKVGVAEAIYADLHEAVWGAALAHFDLSVVDQAHTTIRRAHAELVDRLSECRGQARLLFQLEAALPQTGAVGIVFQRDSSSRRRVEQWVAGALRPGQPAPAADMCWALVFGPVIAVSRRWASGELQEIPPEVPRRLADAAFTTLFETGQPATRGKTKKARDSTGHQASFDQLGEK